MPLQKISEDVKWAAVRMHEGDLLPLETILDVCDFSERTFYWVISMYSNQRGLVANPLSIHRSSKRILHREDVEYLPALVHLKPGYFLNELLELSEQNRSISVHHTTIYRELKRCGVSLKLLKKAVADRNENARAKSMMEMT